MRSWLIQFMALKTFFLIMWPFSEFELETLERKEIDKIEASGANTIKKFTPRLEIPI
jgi:hypothetical protein